MMLGALIGLGASVVGLHISFHADVAASPAIVLSACAAFAAVVLAQSVRGRLGSGLVRA